MTSRLCPKCSERRREEGPAYNSWSQSSSTAGASTSTDSTTLVNGFTTPTLVTEISRGGPVYGCWVGSRGSCRRSTSLSHILGPNRVIGQNAPFAHGSLPLISHVGKGPIDVIIHLACSGFHFVWALCTCVRFRLWN